MRQVVSAVGESAFPAAENIAGSDCLGTADNRPTYQVNDVTEGLTLSGLLNMKRQCLELVAALVTASSRSMSRRRPAMAVSGE